MEEGWGWFEEGGESSSIGVGGSGPLWILPPPPPPPGRLEEEEGVWEVTRGGKGGEVLAD